MVKCESCGADLSEGAKFCSKCGKEIDNVADLCSDCGEKYAEKILAG
jgi:predicted amidophosphoribosyltransferase